MEPHPGLLWLPPGSLAASRTAVRSESHRSNSQARCTLRQAQGKADHATTGARGAHHARGPDDRRAGGAGAVQHPDGHAASRVRYLGRFTGLHIVHPCAARALASLTPLRTGGLSTLTRRGTYRAVAWSSVPLAVPEVGPRTSSGRARRLWAAPTSRGGGGAPPGERPPLPRVISSPLIPRLIICGSSPPPPARAWARRSAGFGSTVRAAWPRSAAFSPSEAPPKARQFLRLWPGRYYHNARTKTTTWQKPNKSKQPPPPPPPRASTLESHPGLCCDSTPRWPPGGSKGHGGGRGRGGARALPRRMGRASRLRLSCSSTLGSRGAHRS